MLKQKDVHLRKNLMENMPEFNDNQEKVFLFKPMTYMNLSGDH